MTKVEHILDAIRVETENQDVSEFIGISDREILRHIAHAQNKIQAEIVKKSNKIFTATKVVSVSNNEILDIPKDAFLGEVITDIKYRGVSNSKYWYPVKQDIIKNRDEEYHGHPRYYARANKKIYLRPIPTSGEVRITYVQALPKPQLKRGSIGSVVLDTSTNTITSLNLEVLTDDIDLDALNRESYVTIVDDIGEIKMQGIRITGVDSDGTVNVHSSFVFEDGETIEPGDIIVPGKRSSTHLHLDEYVDRHIIEYSNAKILQREGSGELTTQSEFLASVANEIIETYASVTDDIVYLPEVNEDFDEF